MQIFIKIYYGPMFIIDVNVTDTIEDVKKIIQEKKNIPPENQMLIFAEKTLEDDRTLADYNIQKQSVFFLEVTYRLTGVNFKVKFKDVEYTTPNWCPGCASGQTLKKFMSEQTGIDIENIEIIKDYIAIQNDMSLENQKIEENDKLYMIVRNLKPIKVHYNEKNFEIYCKKPLKLNEIKDLIRKKVDDLKEFDLMYYSSLLDEKTDINSYGIFDNLTVVLKK